MEKKKLQPTLWLGILTAGFLSLSAFSGQKEIKSYLSVNETDDQLKKLALDILDTKCNTCHRKQNPFMVFNAKNMTKRASKIYRQVFVEKRMPKGSKVQLSDQEYTNLKEWLNTQNIK